VGRISEKVGIAIITHTGHRRFLKPCLESCKKIEPKAIVVAYDCRFGGNPKSPMEANMPTYDTFTMADRWIVGDVGPRVNSWLWLTQYATTMIKQLGCDYVLSLNGDCIFTRPEGVDELYDMMVGQDASVIACELRDEGFAGTTSYFAETETAVAIGNHLVENAFIAKTPEGKGFGNPEGRMGKAISLQGFKCATVRNPEHAQFSYGDRGTWGDVMGFYHLHGAEKYRKGAKELPFPREYYDMRYVNGAEKEALEYYWDTGKTDNFIEKGYWR